MNVLNRIVKYKIMSNEMPKMNIEEAQEEALELQKKVESREAGNYGEAEKLLEEERTKEKLITWIKNMVDSRKTCGHCPYRILEDFLEWEDECNDPTCDKELSLRWKEEREKRLSTLRDIFRDGIKSDTKLRGGTIENYPWREHHKSYDGPFAQTDMESWASKESHYFIQFLIDKIKNGGNIDIDIIDLVNEINKMRKDRIMLTDSERGKRFLRGIRDYFQKIVSEKGNSLNRSDFWKNLSEDEQKRFWDKYRKYNEILLGLNLVSSTPGVFGDGDALSILFKRPKRIHTHFLVGDYDLGIANVVRPKDFLAVVIDKRIKKVPEAIMEVIPDNIPVITSDFRVIRMPSKEKPPEQVEDKSPPQPSFGK